MTSAAALAPRWPSQSLYWEDYDRHPQLKLCSWGAQGAWPRMLAIMWFASPRGHFLIEGRQPAMDELATLWGKPADTFAPLLVELEARGVFSRTADGVIYCRRMVNDEARRLAKKGAPPPADARKEKLSKQRARQARYVQRKRAKATLVQLRGYAAMEALATLADASSHVSADAGDASSAGDVTRQLTRQPGGENVSETLHGEGLAQIPAPHRRALHSLLSIESTLRTGGALLIQAPCESDADFAERLARRTG